MREVDEAAGEAVADSVAAHTDAQKVAQDYIPIILDDDVRQKGRAKQKQMMITRGKLLDILLSTSLICCPPFSSNECRANRRGSRFSTSLHVCCSTTLLLLLICLSQQSLSTWTAPPSERCASRPPGSLSKSNLRIFASSSLTFLLYSDEAFRAVTTNAPPAKRVYLTSVRQNIIKYRNRATSFPSFWLFSLRGDCSVLLTMLES